MQGSAYLQRIEADRAIGWIGTSDKTVKQVEVEVKVSDDSLMLGSATVDLKDPSHPETRNQIEGAWFEIHFLPELLVDLAVEKDTFALELETDCVKLAKKGSHYSFPVKEWLETLNPLYTRERFLYFIPLFSAGKAFEKTLSTENILNSLHWLKEYRLLDQLEEVRLCLLHELPRREFSSEEDRESLRRLFEDSYELLLPPLMMEEILRNASPTFLVTIAKILEALPPEKALEFLEQTPPEYREALGRKKIEKNKEKSSFIQLLKSRKNDPLNLWFSLTDNQRKELFYLFLDAMEERGLCDVMAKLTLSEAMEGVPGWEEFNASFPDEERWRLLGLYLISQETDQVNLLNFTERLLEKLWEGTPVRFSTLRWLLVDKLFHSMQFHCEEEFHRLWDSFFSYVEEKGLCQDIEVRKTLLALFPLLLRCDRWKFLDYYRRCLRFLIFDKDFRLESAWIDRRYWDNPTYQWLKLTEQSRQKSIELLRKCVISHELSAYLDFLETLAWEQVQEIRYRLSKYRINLFDTEEKETKRPWAWLGAGGHYDKYLTARRLKHSEFESYHEAEVIERMKMWRSESPNAYWYRTALRTRSLAPEGRQGFLRDLYHEITDLRSDAGSRWHLGRLLLSELLWSIKDTSTQKFLQSLSQSATELGEELCELLPGLCPYVTLWCYALDLMEEKEDLPPQSEAMLDAESRKLFAEVFHRVPLTELPREQALSRLRERLIFPYTLVLVYSCQAYIPTRQRLISETWFRRAEELGISCRFVVGGGEHSYAERERIYLSVEDSYENLPHKTVEMFRFVSETFSYERYMKIDDDCLVNLDAYFSDDALYKADYYGRLLQRNPGETDRRWHQKKSRSDEARQAIDLSPEPSYYADGSTGYVLSASACRALVQAYRDPANRPLVRHSFMEDKLVGDLLVPLGYRVVSENNSTLIYRKLTEDLEATFWEYNLFPRPDNDVKIVHCETEQNFRKIWNYYLTEQEEFRQRRYFSNRQIDDFHGSYLSIPFLEELKIEEKRLRKARYIGILIAKNRIDALPGYLENCRRGGIEHFIYVDNVSEDGSLDYMLSQEDVSVLVTTQEKNDTLYRGWLETVLVNFCVGKWVLFSDVESCSKGDFPLSQLVEQAEGVEGDGDTTLLIDEKGVSEREFLFFRYTALH